LWLAADLSLANAAAARPAIDGRGCVFRFDPVGTITGWVPWKDQRLFWVLLDIQTISAFFEPLQLVQPRIGAGRDQNARTAGWYVVMMRGARFFQQS